MSHNQHYISQHGDLPHEDVEGRSTGRDDVLYEPRALWQVVDVPFTNQTGVVGEEVILEGTEWMNGSRYDIVLTHMLLAPINYAVTNDAYEVLQNVSVSLQHGATPLSTQRWMPSLGQTLPIAPSPAYQDFALGQFMPYDSSPRAEPATTNARTRTVMFSQPRVFDVARWQFDMPYRLVRRGVVKFGLSRLGAAISTVASEANGILRVTMGFDEAWSSGSAFRQQMRTSMGHLSVGDAINSTPFGGLPLQSGPAGVKILSTADNLFPAGSQFTPKEWQRQEAGRGGGDGSGWLQGFTVHLPNAQNLGEAGVSSVDDVAFGAADSGVSLATRLGVRAETVNGGTNRAWWRPGAPLALVTPTIGASACMKLQAPIRLGSREQLRVILRSEGKNNLLAGLSDMAEEVTQDRDSAGNHKVGVSLCGYAIVTD